ncbi:hypothetical protein MJ904_01785 [Massilia sp. MB5]|uniref:hypothetical protein n=1 Tax=Massilia sp. MB5 TaxID=2919578 RepID=UPI001F0DF21A|nr:hypothetical protein [Massilia sp. MB5]UMR31024.1 hypothetical protein MJ904_01785 [Massilia sp. MB5]
MGGWRAWWQWADTRPGWLCALRLAPLAAGLLALLMGQDDNWDLHNYHLYNAFALLHGKVGYDLAPAQWQSYFNPTLDLLYYGLALHLPGPLAGFLMGALHGLNFPLLAALCRRLLPTGAAGQPAYRLSLLLALAGCLGPAFLSEIGNTMGDNLTALCVLGSLLLLLRQPLPLARPASALRWPLLAGLLAGVGTGLKLTNAGYALALCLALLVQPGSALLRLRAAGVFGLAVLAGIGLSAGHWYWRMWDVFGNPLFPQFNQLFQGPLAAPIGIGDTEWLPRHWGEKLLWPFIFTLDPKRICELVLRQPLWPLLYLALLAWGGALLWRRGRPLNGVPLAPPARLLLVFFSLAYLVWLNLFSIYRYLVPLELLAPLLCWLLAARLLGARRGRLLATVCIALAALPLYSAGGWGHARWAWRAFTVQTPVLAQPAQSMIVTVHGHPAMGWLAAFFPPQLAFAALGSGFPESPAFRARLDAMLAARSGPHYVMLETGSHPRETPRSAAELAQAQARRQAVYQRAQATLASYGLQMAVARCQDYPARVGQNAWPYQLCPLSAAPNAGK